MSAGAPRVTADARVVARGLPRRARSFERAWTARRASKAPRVDDVPLTEWALSTKESVDGGDFRRARAKEASLRSPFGAEAFAWAYWRGYRQMFNALGYPGPDAEAECAATVLAPSKRLLDASCGPGLITEKLAKAPGSFTSVIAIDYSEAMVKEARERLGDDALACCADVSDLPFADEVFDAVHSSAGAHCWDDPVKGFVELHRTLRPGGKALVSTVVLLKTTGSEEDYTRKRKSNTPFWNERAVCRMMESVGFRNVEVVRKDKCFVAIKATK